MLEQPMMTRSTRSVSRGASPTRGGRYMRGTHRGGNRIQPIIWNQEQQQQQMMSGKFKVEINCHWMLLIKHFY